jgi:hypothetical protein
LKKVSDVWSPSQMKEAKDEIYKQKSRWVAAYNNFCSNNRWVDYNYMG